MDDDTVKKVLSIPQLHGLVEALTNRHYIRNGNPKMWEIRL